jgi:poly(3-hydroxybutyrate) depolymerase
MKIEKIQNPNCIRITVQILLASLASISTPFMSAVTVNDFVARVYTNAANQKLPYRLFIPTNYSADLKYPLVYYLHSALEFGADNKTHLTAEPGAMVFAAETNQTRYPCFMLAPQCPSGTGYWTDGSHPAQLLGLLDQIQQEFSIDPDRIYLTGMSMGGSMTWQFLTQYPDRFAAAIPMSPGAVSPLSKLTNALRTAVWNFHAADDGAVSASNSRNMIDTLRKNGGSPIYTEYASGGHSSTMWTPAFRTPGLVDWLMAQRRGQPSTVRPFIQITQPTAEPLADWTARQITIDGTVSDPEMQISQVTWKNHRNNISGTAAGTNNWSATGIPLHTGTNLINVIAKGTSWSASLRGSTTYNDSIRVIQSDLVVVASLQNGELTLQWSGGKPPFVLQACTELSCANWSPVLTTTNRWITLPATNPAAFYRVWSDNAWGLDQSGSLE